MKKVLIIDDAASVLWLVDRIFADDYKAISMSCLEAWSFISEGNRFDLVISASIHDIELFEKIRNSCLLKDIPLVMLSGCENLKVSA